MPPPDGVGREGGGPKALSALQSGAGAGMAAAGLGARGGPLLHPAPGRNRSRLWSAMSFGDMDSLQNALDAFKAEEEIASIPLSGLPGLSESGLATSPSLGAIEGPGLRPRRRKPPRGNSSFLLRTADSLPDISLTKLGIKVCVGPGAVRYEV